MKRLVEKLSDQVVPSYRRRIADLVAAHGKNPLGSISVSQLTHGLRDVRALVCDTSVVDPGDGLKVRGRPIRALRGHPVEALFWLLLTGELPTRPELSELQAELLRRAEWPDGVETILGQVPVGTPPMSLLTILLLASRHRSRFAQVVCAGVDRQGWWRYALEDAIDILALLPLFVGAIYRLRVRSALPAAPLALEWAERFSQLLGFDDPLIHDLLRLSTVVHSDHESGHVSAMASHIVGSALSDPYYALAAGMCGLAGPRHGGANENATRFVLDLMRRFGGVPRTEEIEAAIVERLDRGLTIPGFGHAVLRGEDPRFASLYSFGQRRCENQEIFQTLIRLASIAPRLLREKTQIQNPLPNVDGISGIVYHAVGLTEIDMYTTFFAVGISLGLLAQYVLNRAILSPIVHSRSITLPGLEERVFCN